MMPWAAFLPTAIGQFFPELRRKCEAALTLFLWAALVLGFFTLSARQEYYSLPALPALALLIGGTLAWADAHRESDVNRSILRWSLWLLVPITTAVAAACGYFAFTAPTPAPGIDLNHVLSSNPEMYNLSLGHVFDLTSEAMGFFRGPLLTVAICMAALGPISHLFRRRGRTLIANIVIAGAMCGVLMAAHEGLARFYPILGSKEIADAIETRSYLNNNGVPLLIDGELTAGSSLLFYTNNPVYLVNGRVNGPWFGSFWPDAPHVFLDDKDLDAMWQYRGSLLLMTYHPEQRIPELCRAGAVVRIASSGGKTLLFNGVLLDDSHPPLPDSIDLCPNR
jgi:hypothetical protein